MSTPIKVSSMTFPASLGVAKPGSSYATVSVPITQTRLPVLDDGVTASRMFNGIFITAFPGTGSVAANTKPIYVCTNSSAPDLTNFLNVVGILQPGDVWPRSKDWACNRDVGTLYIGAENATDFALIAIDLV